MAGCCGGARKTRTTTTVAGGRPARMASRKGRLPWIHRAASGGAMSYYATESEAQQAATLYGGEALRAEDVQPE
ncbi:hypothetical protein [Streptomyces sp. NBRC 109706]|uniref:hypothetical protein n=1 Tax=Streptomyces sp. NBRC 109706 TaxID=1550035 RepID=UPI000780BA45|nr:hypothetical protein [Streptomyces sp. NBRC 109706]